MLLIEKIACIHVEAKKAIFLQKEFVFGLLARKQNFNVFVYVFSLYFLLIPIYPVSMHCQ